PAAADLRVLGEAALRGDGRLVAAAPATTVDPHRLGEARRADAAEARAADGDDVRRRRRVLRRRAVIPGRDEDADAGLREVRVVPALESGLAGAPAVGHVLGVRLRVVLGGEQIAEAVAGGL